MSHLSEMPIVRVHRHHHTALRLYGVHCTACVKPLRGCWPTLSCGLHIQLVIDEPNAYSNMVNYSVTHRLHSL